MANRAPVPRRPSFRVWAGRSGHETEVLLKEKSRTIAKTTGGEPLFFFTLETLEVINLDHVVLPARRAAHEKYWLSYELVLV